MASIKQRGNKYSVIYCYYDLSGKRRQKWETFESYEAALNRKTELEDTQVIKRVSAPKIHTLAELLKEYVNLYGKTKWSLSAYANQTKLIDNYIKPFLGDMPLKKMTVHTLEQYYRNLLVTKAKGVPGKKETGFVSAATVQKIHSLLRSAFNQAVKWELLDKNPAVNATVPKHETQQRSIWDAPTFFKAVELCTDDGLRVCMHLSFACSLRLGEILALTWDCVDLSQEKMKSGNPSILINKTIQRVSKDALEALNKKDVFRVFPQTGYTSKSVLVTKKPKTVSSIRKVFLPMTVANMLISWKAKQDQAKDLLGSEYHDYDLVIAKGFGQPYEIFDIDQAFTKLIRENNLPQVVFHSLRHTSITYKLKLNGGDIKAVQGDSGHSQTQMITEQYSHILQESRVTNAQLIEQAFYQKKDEKQYSVPEMEHEPINAHCPPEQTDDLSDREVVDRFLNSPELIQLMREMLKASSKDK